jgi:hypothetical protein
LVTHPDFDALRLIALLGITGCKLICTDDKRAEKYWLNKKLHPEGKKPPAIYKDAKKHTCLLTPAHIGKCCTENNKLNKVEKIKLSLPTK